MNLGSFFCNKLLYEYWTLTIKTRNAERGRSRERYQEGGTKKKLKTKKYIKESLLFANYKIRENYTLFISY